MMVGAPLDRWIADLRNRVERGDLDRLEPFDLGYGTTRLPATVTIRVMLSDLAHLDSLPPEARAAASYRSHRCALLDDFRRLRDLID